MIPLVSIVETISVLDSSGSNEEALSVGSLSIVIVKDDEGVGVSNIDSAVEFILGRVRSVNPDFVDVGLLASVGVGKADLVRVFSIEINDLRSITLSRVGNEFSIWKNSVV